MIGHLSCCADRLLPRSLGVRLFIAVLLCLFGTGEVGAQVTLNWAGPAGDFIPRDFHDAANWNPAVAPGVLDTTVVSGGNLPNQYFDILIGGPIVAPGTPSVGADAFSLHVIDAADVFFPTDTIENVPGSRGLVLHAAADALAPAMLIDNDGYATFAGPFVAPGEPAPVLDPSVEHLLSMGLMVVGDTGSGNLFVDLSHIRTHALTFGAQAGSNGRGTFSSMRFRVDTETVIGDGGAGDVFAAGVDFTTGSLHLGANGGTGVLNLNSQSLFNVVTPPAPGEHALSVGPGSRLTVSGSTLMNSADGHLHNNGGTVRIDQQAVFDDIDVTNTNGGLLTFDSVSVQGALGGGSIMNDAAAEMNITNSQLSDYSIQNNGGLVSINQSTLAHNLGGFISNNGGALMNILSSGMEGITIDNSVNSSLTLDNASIHPLGPGDLPSIVNEGLATITNSSQLYLDVQNRADATLSLEDSTLNGSLNNDGALHLYNLSPPPVPLGTHHPPAVSQITGSFNQFAGASIAFNLSPLGADQLIVAGVATLGGMLQINASYDFDLSYGDTLTVISSSLGEVDLFNGTTFDAYAGLELSVDKILVPVYEFDRLDLVATLPADFNHDGQVDVADLSTWATGFGNTQAVFAMGDADQNGQVDVADLSIWATRFGTTISDFPPALNALNAAVAAPEPTSLVLLGLGGLLGMRRRRAG